MTEVTYVENDKKRTYPITFRMPEKLVEDLRKEAANTQVSLNTLANQVFDRYIVWERHSGKLGLIPMTRPFLRAVTRHLAKEEIKYIAHNASKDAIKELILLSRGDLTIGSFVAVFNEWLKASWMVHRYERNEEGHHYVIHHDIGERWSLYLAELLTSICQDLVNVSPRIRIRKDGLSISLPAQ